jgi:hypothetical protein
MKEAGLVNNYSNSHEEESKNLKRGIVRIGCENGLASKYTSFVAVDEDTKDQAKAKANEAWIMQTRYVPSQFPSSGPYLQAYSPSYSPPSYSSAHLRSLGSPIKSTNLDFFTKCSAPSSMGTTTDSSIQFKEHELGVPRGYVRSTISKSKGFSGFGLFSRFKSTEENEKSLKTSDKNKQRMIFTARDRDSSTKTPHEKTPEDYLHALVATQSFDGSFSLNQEFSDAIGKPLKVMVAEAKKSSWTPEAWATALALTYLTQEFATMKESWELVHLKGTKWMQKNFGLQIDLILAAAKEFLIKA